MNSKTKPLILVVEDNIACQRLMMFYLRSRYDTCFAVSVAEAKKELANNAVDLVLLDLTLLGDEDGLDLVRYLRQTNEWYNMPVIAVTAHAFTTDRDNCLATGCNDYMTKPFKGEALIAKIKQHLDKTSP